MPSFIAFFSMQLDPQYSYQTYHHSDQSNNWSLSHSP